jgi:hypothetical protein
MLVILSRQALCIRPGALADRMGIVKTDKPLTIRIMQS